MTATIETNIHTDNANQGAKPSDFSWYELHTPDAAAAAAFYSSVLGWRMQDSGMPDKNYTLACVGGVPVGGVLGKPVSAFAPGQRAGWMGYIGVHDVHLFSRLLQERGGTIHRQAEEIPGVGLFAVVADPQGVIFVLFQPFEGMSAPPKPDLSTSGMPVWQDLAAPDWPAEFAFYSGLFGWTKVELLSMGPGSEYQMFAAGAGPIGGMTTLPPPTKAVGWIFYFQVEEMDAAIERVNQQGGSVVHGPSPIPGGQQMAHCLDPQGAIFGIVGKARQ